VADAFVSYAREDIEFVRRLHAALADRKKDAWVDWEGIPVAAEWRSELSQGIDGADAFVFVLSPDSLDSPVCAAELEQAVRQNKRIFPLLRREPDGREVPERLSATNWVFFRDSDDFAAAVESLVEALDTDLPRVKAHTRLLVRAGEWEQKSKDGSFLLRGSDLTDAEGLLAASGQPELTDLQRDYIVASRRAATRRQRSLLSGVSVALIVAVALAIVALIQRQAAVNNQHAAQSRALTTEATAQLGVNPELSVLLALEALKQKQTPGAVLALRQAVGADQLRRVLSGHLGKVQSIAFDPASPDLVASGGVDGTVRLWHASSGRSVAVFRNVPAGVNVADVAFSRRGALLAAGYSDGTTRVWDVRTLRLALPVLSVDRQAVASIAFSPLFPELLVASADGNAYGWSTITGKPRAEARPPGHATGAAFDRIAFSPTAHSVVLSYGHGVTVLYLNASRRIVTLGGHHDDLSVASFSPNGQRIVTASFDGVAQLWTADGHRVARLSGLQLQVTFGLGAEDAAFSSDSSQVAVGFVDGSVDVFDARTGHIDTILPRVGGAVATLRFSTIGPYLAVGYFDGTTRVWDARSGTQLSLLAAGAGTIRSVAFSPDGQRLAAGGLDGAVRVWEPLPGRVVGRVGQSGFQSITPDGRRYVASGGVFDIATGREVRTLPLSPSGGALPTFSPDGRLMALVSPAATRVVNLQSGTVTVLDSSPEVKGALYPSNYVLHPADLAADDRRLVAPAANGGIRVWDVRSGHVVATLHAHAAAVETARFSPDGKWVVSAGDDGVAYLQRADGAGPATPLRGAVAAVTDAAFSAHGSMVATTTESNLLPLLQTQLWNARTGHALGRPLTDAGFFVNFSHDGRSVVAGSPSGAVLARIGGEGFGSVLRLGSGPIGFGAWFSPNDATVVVPSPDAERIYDAGSGSLLETLAVGQDVPAFDFSADGSRLVAAVRGTPTLYACDICGTTAQVERAARSLLTRQLTPAERARFIGGA
jgi:WD40 repeat protein